MNANLAGSDPKTAEGSDPKVRPIREFRRALSALEREVELSLADQSDCCGVTSAQCHLILELDSRGSASVGELAGALELDPSTLSRAVDSLVKAGFASRREDQSNRRRLILELTEAGQEKADYINDACDAYYEEILAQADEPRRRALSESVAYLAQAIKVKRVGAAPCCAGKPKKEER
jgi:DNA-binding MarR family transcriptional regulator